MKIYTKTGDAGISSLADGSRVYKDNNLLKTYGTVDELNAFVGWLIAEKNETFLTKVQNELFFLGGLLATPTEKWNTSDSVHHIEGFIQEIEAEIDRMQALIPPFRGFILPQGNEAIARAHVCRTVCRRAEREMVTLFQTNALYEKPLQLLNRLSDFFFILARFFHQNDNIVETIYESGK